MKRARLKDATKDVIALGDQAVKDLMKRLRITHACYLRRDKELLRDILPDKEHKTVFCQLSDMQKRAYERLLYSVDYTVLRE